MSILTTVRDRRIEIAAPDDLPDGTQVRVDVTALPPTIGREIRFMTEEEQSDDPAAIARWIAEVDALPALSMTVDEEADLASWRKRTKEFNLDAMRRKMNEDVP